MAIQNNTEWKKLCEQVLGSSELVQRPAFLSNVLRVANRALLDRELEPEFAILTVNEAIARLEAAGVAWGRYAEVRTLPSWVLPPRFPVRGAFARTISSSREKIGVSTLIFEVST